MGGCMCKLSFCLFVCLSFCLTVCLTVCLPVCISVCLSPCWSVFLFKIWLASPFQQWLSVLASQWEDACVSCVYVLLSVYKSFCLFVCLSLCPKSDLRHLSNYSPVYWHCNGRMHVYVVFLLVCMCVFLSNCLSIYQYVFQSKIWLESPFQLQPSVLKLQWEAACVSCVHVLLSVC